MVRIIAIFILTLLTSQGQAQLLDLKVSHDTLSTDSILHVTYKVEASCNCTDLTFDQFQTVIGPNVSKSTQFINGQMSQQTSCEYYLKPLESGVFYLPNQFCYATTEKEQPIVVIKGFAPYIPKKEAILKQRKLKKI